MWFLVYFIFLLLLVAAQTTLLKHLAFGGVTPDLALIFAIHCGIHFRGNVGVGMGFLTGMVQDSLSGGLLGVNILSKSLISFFFSALKTKIMVEGLVPVSFFIVLASFFDGLVFYVFWSMLLKGAAPDARLLPSFVIYALYNAAAGPVLFLILNRQKKWIIRRFPTQVFGSS